MSKKLQELINEHKDLKKRIEEVYKQIDRIVRGNVKQTKK